MALSISATVLLGITVVVLVRRLRPRRLRAGCTLFGFTLAATGLASTINSGITALAGLISSL